MSDHSSTGDHDDDNRLPPSSSRALAPMSPAPQDKGDGEGELTGQLGGKDVAASGLYAFDADDWSSSSSELGGESDKDVDKNNGNDNGMGEKQQGPQQTSNKNTEGEGEVKNDSVIKQVSVPSFDASRSSDRADSGASIASSLSSDDGLSSTDGEGNDDDNHTGEYESDWTTSSSEEESSTGTGGSKGNKDTTGSNVSMHSPLQSRAKKPLSMKQIQKEAKSRVPPGWSTDEGSTDDEFEIACVPNSRSASPPPSRYSRLSRAAPPETSSSA